MTSSFVLGIPQIDGRVEVIETHIDDFGESYVFRYLAVQNADFNNILLSRVSILEEELANKEVEEIIDNDFNRDLKYATLSRLLTIFRDRYKTAEKLEVLRLATLLIRAINNGRITDIQCRQAFNLTNAQWNNLKTRLQTYKDKWDEIQTLLGE